MIAMRDDWVVTITFDTDIVDVERFDAIEEALLPYNGTVARRPRVRNVDDAPFVLDVTAWVAADNYIGAVTAGRDVIAPLVDAWPILSVEAVTEGLFYDRADAPSLPAMVSASEAADILDISRQRVHQLRSTAGFPAPLFELRTGPIWARSAIVAFEAAWTRRPGPRPADQPATTTVNRGRPSTTTVSRSAASGRYVTKAAPKKSTRRKNSLRPVD